MNNTIGKIFQVHTFGESHGPAVGCVIENCPAGVALDMEKIQIQVNRRKTGQHAFHSQRKEDDEVEFLSGVFEKNTLGTPIGLLIRNKDARPHDYEHLKDIYRPGHADFTWQEKFGIRDYRGGGRSSFRITAPVVAAGEIARQVLQYFSGAKTECFVSGAGKANWNMEDWMAKEPKDRMSYRQEEENRFQESFEKEIHGALQNKDTIGGRVTVIIDGLDTGIGEPFFGKMQTRISEAMMSIPAVKAIEFGCGFRASGMTGSAHNDVYTRKEDRVVPKTNRHGGILGGISTGQPVYFNIYFKPISSIGQKQRSVDAQGQEIELEIGGRHDVFAVPRALPLVEALTQIVLLDLYLMKRINKI